ncbi:MAG TPA: ATP-binding protein, partial [Bacteroidales bacterium]|nr:ATP-binding protein [Bacteroidales bacterium]
IYSSALRLNRLVERYLLFIQLELKLGNWERVSQPFPVYASLKQKAFEVADRYDRLKDLFFSGNAVSSRLPLMLLLQLCDELLDNAFKFSKVGDQVSFRFDLESEHLMLEIEDHGPGFTKEQYSKVSPFVKFNLNFRSNEGSGLGLSIGKRLLTDIDGRLQIIPKKEQGTIIRVLV